MPRIVRFHSVSALGLVNAKRLTKDLAPIGSSSLRAVLRAGPFPSRNNPTESVWGLPPMDRTVRLSHKQRAQNKWPHRSGASGVDGLPKEVPREGRTAALVLDRRPQVRPLRKFLVQNHLLTKLTKRYKFCAGLDWPSLYATTVFRDGTSTKARLAPEMGPFF
jgi:hypothetical protein